MVVVVVVVAVVVAVGFQLVRSVPNTAEMDGGQ